MTIIATWNYNTLPLFLGDILVTSDIDSSTPKARELEIDIPLVQGVNNVLKDKTNFTVQESTQKLSIIRDNLIAAWSGSYHQAHEILSELDNKIENIKITKESLIEFCENISKERYDNVDLIFGVLDSRKQGDRIHNHVYRCSSFISGESFNHPIFGWVSAAGSGKKTFYDALDQSQDAFSRTGIDLNITDPSDQKIFMAYQQAIGFVSSFVGMECVSGGKNIFDRWGGGYEIAFPLDRFHKIEDILYSFWFLEKSGKQDYTLHLVNKLYKLAYHEDLLIYYVLDNFQVKYPKINFDTNIVLVPPILKRVGDYNFIDAQRLFNFEHKYLATTLWDLTENRSNDVFLKIDALPSDRSNISVVTESNKIGLAFKLQYLEELAELCGQHFKKKVKGFVLG